MKLPESMTRATFGGRECSDFFAQLLANRGIYFTTPAQKHVRQIKGAMGENCAW